MCVYVCVHVRAFFTNAVRMSYQCQCAYLCEFARMCERTRTRECVCVCVCVLFMRL